MVATIKHALCAVLVAVACVSHVVLSMPMDQAPSGRSETQPKHHHKEHKSSRIFSPLLVPLCLLCSHVCQVCGTR